MALSVVCLPGDGIGPEVMGQTVRVLHAFGIPFQEEPFGGSAIDTWNSSLPPPTLQACKTANAVLLGAVGGPMYPPGVAERGMLTLRKELDVYANLRPSVGDGIDMLIVRELVGGLYFGGSGVREDGEAYDICTYYPFQIERVARRAFELAQSRRGKLLSVDKSNVLATSKLWRETVTRVAADFPDVELKHGLVDAVGMWIVTQPEEFDVLVMDNMFGDILSDVAAGVTGGLGLAGSASLADSGPGIFEPVHGSAPDIAGKGIANPTGMLRSLAMALELGLDEPEKAKGLRIAIEHALKTAPTPDVGGTATTVQFGDAVLASLQVAV